MRLRLTVRILLCLATAGISACGASSPKPWSVSESLHRPNQRVVGGGWTVQVRGRAPHHATLGISSAPAGAATWEPDLGSLERASGVSVGRPVLVSLRGARLGPRGASLQSRLAAPVPVGSRAVLAYFDPRLRTWKAVATTLSADRQTLTASVHHFSVWDSIEYGAGWLLDVRANPPQCEQPAPKWVQDHGVVYLDDENAPLRWCAGHDPHDASTLVVKVVMNRSYGTALYPATRPQWTYDDIFGGGPQAFFSSLLARSLAVPSPVRRSFGGQLPLVPGDEIDLGFTEAQVRSIGPVPLVHVGRVFSNALAGLIYSAINKVAGLENVAGKQAAAIAAFVAIAQCESDIGQPIAKHDWRGALKGLLDCLTANAPATAQLLARALASSFPKASPEELGKLAGKIAGKLLLVAAADATFDIGTWIADQHLNQSAFDMSVFPTIKHRPRPKPAPATTTPPLTTTTPVQPSPPSATSSLAIGAHFDSRCVVAWPTAPVTTSTSIQMTMSCQAVPENKYLFTQIDYNDPSLPVSPAHARAHVEGTIVDVATSDYGYKELVVEASSVRLE
jgi:hypothetical protein